MSSIVVTGSFDDLKSKYVRFLEEASKLGDVQVLLWSDEAVRSLEGKSPKFPIEERLYVLQAIRYVSTVLVADGPIERDAIRSIDGFHPNVWVVDEASDTPQKELIAKRAA